jgi:hypothetical protein
MTPTVEGCASRSAAVPTCKQDTAHPQKNQQLKSLILNDLRRRPIWFSTLIPVYFFIL